MAIYRDGTSKANLELIGFEYDDENSLPTRIQVKDKDGYNRWLLISDTSDIYQISYNGRFPYKGGTIEVMVGDWINLDPTFYENGEYVPEVGQHWTSVTVALPMQEATVSTNNVEVVPIGEDSQGHAYQGLSKVTVSLPMQEKTFSVTPTSGTGTTEITPDSPNQGLSKVTVNYNIGFQPTQIPTPGIVETTIGQATFPSGYKFTGVTGSGVLKIGEEKYIPVSSGTAQVDYGTDPSDNKYGMNDQFRVICTPDQYNNYKYNSEDFRASVIGTKSATATFDDLRALTSDEISRGVCTEVSNFTTETQSSLSDVFYTGSAKYDLKFSGSTNVANWFNSIGLIGTSSSSASYRPTNLIGLKWVATGTLSWSVPTYFMKGGTLNYFETNAQVIGFEAFRNASINTVYLNGTLSVAFTPSTSAPETDPFRGSSVQRFVVPDSMYASYQTAWADHSFYLNKLYKQSEVVKTRFFGL